MQLQFLCDIHACVSLCVCLSGQVLSHVCHTQATHPRATPRLVAMEACDHSHQLHVKLAQTRCRRSAAKRSADLIDHTLLLRALACDGYTMWYRPRRRVWH